MADVKISGLPASTTPLAGTEVLPIVQSGTTKKVSIADVTAGRAISAASASITGDLTVDTSTLKVDSANNRVGIGIATPATTLHTSVAGATNELRISTTTSGDVRVVFDLDGAYYNWIDSYRSSGDVVIGTTNTARFKVLGTGGDVRIEAGNLVQGTAAKGVNFTANTPAAGMTSQLLNWYEEGTWTPTVTAFSGTITTVGTVSGTYTRIGRVVTLNYSVAITNNGTGTVAVVLSSVPFTPAKNSFGMGKETQATGNANICFVNAGTAEVLIQTFTATYPANNNTTLEGQITFTV